MKKLKGIPFSTATTAWGLLQDVKRAIMEEPKRVEMSCYSAKLSPEAGGPQCGSVGCFAGWVNMLRGGRPGSFSQTDDHSAMTLLGPLNYYTIRSRTDPKADLDSYVFNSGEGDSCADTNPGTRAHARAVVQRINRFMAVNEVALKARILPPIGDVRR